MLLLLACNKPMVATTADANTAALHTAHMHRTVLRLLPLTLPIQDLCPLPNYFAPVRLEALANAMALNNKINKEVDEERAAAGGNNNGSLSNSGSDDEEDDDGTCRTIIMRVASLRT
jgi:hypothetical protein